MCMCHHATNLSSARMIFLVPCMQGDDGMDGLAGEGEGEEHMELMEAGGAAAQGPGMAVEARSRITTRYLTKYEKARVLGTRALQIRCGCVCTRCR